MNTVNTNIFFLGKDQPYFAKNTLLKLILPKSYMKLMLEFLIDNLFVRFGGRVFQQTIGISTNMLLY